MNKRNLPSLALFALLVLALALAGCGAPAQPAAEPAASADQPVAETADQPAAPASDADAQAPTEEAAAPADESAPAAGQGGTAVLIIPEEPASLNQYLAVAAIVRQVADATTGPLATVNENGEFVPVLAAELPTVENGGVSEDFLTVTWKLRPDLKWSDGEPLTSDDIKFTWEAASNPDSGAVLSVGFDLIDSIETPDPLTAVIHFKEVNQAYLQQFMFGLLPRHAAGAPEEMADWDWNRNPVSAGPFVVTDWVAGDTITMERNPNYYLEGQPYLDRLIFKVVPDPGAQMAMMMQGEAQVQLWPGAEKDVYDSQVEGVASLQEIPGPWNMAVRFNLSQPFDDDPGPEPPHPILGDLRVRQALAHALDYDTIVNDVNPGVEPTASPFAYGWYACDIERPYEYDVEKAKALLDEAGWVEGPDGMRVAQGAMYAEDGTPLVLQLEGYTNFQPLTKLEEFMVESWKAIGADVQIQNDDFSIIFGSYDDGAPRKTGNFDMVIYDARLDLEPQATVANLFHSTAIPGPDNLAGANYSRWVNADADLAIEAAGSTVDVEARHAAYCDLAELIATELPELHFYLFTEGYGASDLLSDYVVNMWGSLTWDVQNWKLAQ
ncbi:MAG: peptide ABC transporter substrate-binding protein [Anaerolineae bacterium]|nr:peptide ABC transporter substrate-binding protein [Anaerolineae bacterium]MCB0205006.1 peptide ABC transporter substrate-binding protein [Anaerolineae bacterium]